MAKNKKSKILAMALCASVMAGIYASPVMAKELTLDNNSSVTTGTTTSGGYKQNEVHVNINDGVNGSQTIGTFYSNEMEAGFKTDYTMTASTFTLEAGGETWASLTVDGLTYTNRNTLNNVSLTADGLTFYNRNSEATAVLNAAAINSWNEKTQNIDAKKTVAGETKFDGKVIADKFGTTLDGFYVDENGTLKSNKITVHKGEFTVDRNGAVKAANGAFTVDKNGTVKSESDFITTDKAGNKKYSLNTIGTNTAGITRENVTKNITKTNIENSSITSAGELYINKANGQTNFSVDKYGNANVRNNLIANGISVNNDRFTVAKDGTVKSESDFITTDKAGNKKYSLNAVGADLDILEGNVGNIGDNVKHIEHYDNFAINGHEYDATVIEESVAITKDRGIDVIGANGASVATITRQGVARFGAEAGLNVSIKNGDVTSTYYDEEGKVGHYSLNNIGDKTQNMWADGSQTNFSHSVNVEGSFSSGNGAVNLKGNWGEEASIELRDAKDKTYTLTATQLGNINNMITGAGVLENVVSINGAAVKGTEFGGLKISDVTLENGGIWAEKLNGKLIEEYVTDEEISGDLENIGGIDRKDVTGEGKPGEGTTTIENLLNVSGDSVSASLGNNSFTFDNSGFKFTGVVNLGSASDIYFNYGGVGNGTDYAGSYTLEDLADTVADIYDRTQAIDYENGKTTIKGDLDVVKDSNAGSGEGDDSGTGEGGNTGNGNGHYDGNLDVDGGITAGDSTIGGVGLEGGTVIADKVVTGNTTLDNEGLNVGGQTSVTADGVNVGGNGGTTVSKDGVSIADKTIISDHDVVINEGTADRVSLSETADRVGNLEQGVSELNNRVGELEDRIDKVGAMAAAIANLRTMGYDPAAPTEVAVGIGQYRDETGAALGLFHYPNRDFMLSLSVSTSGDEVMGGIGATWKFGRKSPEKVAEIKKAQAEADARRAEEAKLAKAEEMKQAAKEAKIKAQQERHAKLAAERAAQAEAAK